MPKKYNVIQDLNKTNSIGNLFKDKKCLGLAIELEEGKYGYQSSNDLGLLEEDFGEGDYKVEIETTILLGNGGRYIAFISNDGSFNEDSFDKIGKNKLDCLFKILESWGI